MRRITGRTAPGRPRARALGAQPRGRDGKARRGQRDGKVIHRKNKLVNTHAPGAKLPATYTRSTMPAARSTRPVPVRMARAFHIARFAHAVAPLSLPWYGQGGCPYAEHAEKTAAARGKAALWARPGGAGQRRQARPLAARGPVFPQKTSGPPARAGAPQFAFCPAGPGCVFCLKKPSPALRAPGRARAQRQAHGRAQKASAASRLCAASPSGCNIYRMPQSTYASRQRGGVMVSGHMWRRIISRSFQVRLNRALALASAFLGVFKPLQALALPAAVKMPVV